MGKTSADDRSNQAVLPVLISTLPPLGIEVSSHTTHSSVASRPVSWRKPSGPLFHARSTRDFRRVTGCFVRVKKPSQATRQNALNWSNRGQISTLPDLPDGQQAITGERIRGCDARNRATGDHASDV